MLKELKASTLVSDLVETNMTPERRKPLANELPDWFDPTTCAIALHPNHRNHFTFAGIDVYFNECVCISEMIVFDKYVGKSLAKIGDILK